MKKVKCVFDGHVVECKVNENLGFQGGVYVVTVIFNNKERFVQKYKGQSEYRERTIQERFGY
jgi:hypothetical protein